MEKLKASIIRLANENSQPNKPLLSPSQVALIEKKLLFAFPAFHTPTHPAYSVMIESAIKGLNEVEGSTKESISEYIKGEYYDLPWAHDVYLSHHLNKLCENGEILLNSTSKCYTTPARAMLQDCNLSKRQRYRKLRVKTKECLIDQEEKGEGNSSEGKVVQLSENRFGLQEEGVRLLKNRKIKPRRRRLEFEDDENGDRNIIGSRRDLGVTRTNEALALENGDDLIEEWDYVTDDDLSSVGKLRDKREGHGITEEGNVCDDTSAAKESAKKASSTLNASTSNPEVAVQESGSKEGELMIVPYVGNNGINQILEQKSPMIIYGLTELPKQEHQKSEDLTKKKLKGHQERKKVYSESMSKKSNVSQVKKKAYSKSTLAFPELHQQPEPLSQRRPETKVSEMDIVIVPPWLMPMLKAQYFIRCSVHMDSTRNQCNVFCLDCMGDAVCHHCFFQYHKYHRVVQIRKASYRNSVRVYEIEKHIDISNIQTYVINSAKIVFLNAREELKPPKGSTKTCEICLQSLIDCSRFCSLGCKFFPSLQESPKFQELAVDRSQQTCTQKDDGFIEHLEKHKYLDPPYLSNQEDPVSSEYSENLSLHKVLKKCAKRKKHGVIKPSVNTTLATAEAFSLSGTKLLVDLPNSENTERITPRIAPESTSIMKEKKQWRQERLSELEANSTVNERGPMLASDSVFKPHELETNDGMLFPDMGPPGFVLTARITSDDLQSEREKYQNLAINRTSLSKPSLQNFEHQIEDQERRGFENDAELVDLEAPVANFIERNVLTGSQVCEQDLKRERGRSQIHLEACEEDSARSLNKKLQQIQEGLCKPESSLNLKQKNKELKRDGRQRPLKEKGAIKQAKKSGREKPSKHMKASKEDGRIRVEKNLEETKEVEPINRIEGSDKSTNDQNSLLKKAGRGRPRKRLESTSKLQIEGLKKKGRGRPRKLKEPAKEVIASLSNLDPSKQEGIVQDGTLSMNLHSVGQEKLFEALNSEHSQQNNQKLKKDGGERPRQQKEKTNDEDSTASMNMHLQEIKQLSKDGRGRPRKQKQNEVNNENSAVSVNLLHKSEKAQSEQEKERNTDDFPDAKPDQSENEVHKPNLSSDRETSEEGSRVEKKDYKLQDCPVDESEKSQSEVHRMLETQLEMPFPDNDKQHNQLTQEQDELQIFMNLR